MSKRGNHPVNIPEVLIPYKLGDLNEHPDYPMAKAGDFEAALRIAQQMITESIADQLIQRFDRKALLLPVLAQEAQGCNKIPLVLVKHEPLLVSVRLSPSEYASLMNEMQQAALQMRMMLNKQPSRLNHLH